MIKRTENVGSEATDNAKNSLLMAKKNLLAWIKTHKKQLILAGLSIVSLIGLVVGIKKKDELWELWKSLSRRADNSLPEIPEATLPTETSVTLLDNLNKARAYTRPTESFDVRMHLRNLHKGQHHSAEKGAEAIAYGIDLPPNQTIVDAYRKNVA